MKVIFNQGSIPVKPLTEIKVEAKITGGIASIKQKRDVIVAELALSTALGLDGKPSATQLFNPGTIVYLQPDAAHQPWNRTIYSSDEVDFVLAPMSAVLGIEVPVYSQEQVPHDH